MLDDKANRAMEEVLQRGAALIDALNLTPVERDYAVAEAQHVINHVTDQYFDDKLMGGRQVRPHRSRSRRGLQFDILRQVGDEGRKEVPRSG